MSIQMPNRFQSRKQFYNLGGEGAFHMCVTISTFRFSLEED